jgi:hypothetical protein
LASNCFVGRVFWSKREIPPWIASRPQIHGIHHILTEIHG